MEKKSNGIQSNSASYALITGATSGIGYEIAKLLGKDGYSLVLVARDEEQLAKVAQEFSKFKVDIVTMAIDLFEEMAGDEVYRRIKEMKVDVRILINNAGQGQYGKFVEEPLDRHLDVIRLNIMSLVTLTHYFLNDMLEAGEGKILQVGSEVSKAPSPLLSVYAATKAFVLSFSEAVINEIEDSGVTMTVLMPGATDTDFFDKAEMEYTVTYRENKLDPPEVVAQLAYEALQKGERRVVGPAGRKNVAMATLTPDNLVAKNMLKSMEPSEKDDSEIRHQPAHTRSREVKRSRRDQVD